MTEFWVGFLAGVIGSVSPIIAWMFFYVGARLDEVNRAETCAEEQPDIRLTKIKSEHVRTFDAERD